MRALRGHIVVRMVYMIRRRRRGRWILFGSWRSLIRVLRNRRGRRVLAVHLVLLRSREMGEVIRARRGLITCGASAGGGRRSVGTRWDASARGRVALGVCGMLLLEFWPSLRTVGIAGAGIHGWRRRGSAVMVGRRSVGRRGRVTDGLGRVGSRGDVRRRRCWWDRGYGCLGHGSTQCVDQLGEGGLDGSHLALQMSDSPGRSTDRGSSRVSQSC